MKRFDHLNWMTTEKPVWFVAEYLLTIGHTPLISAAQGTGIDVVPQFQSQRAVLRVAALLHELRRCACTATQ